jgi:NADH dehydrogenase
VIVGGGFGGLSCARRLDGQAVEVLLIDAHNYHLFTPLLYQVATSLLNPSDIAYPFRRAFRRSPNVRFHQGTVARIDPGRRTVGLHDGEELRYDVCVLATGSMNNYFGNEDIARSTIGLKHLEEALRLRNHVLSCLERASHEPDALARKAWLTFVVAGGGPTGVEYAGALGELFKIVLGRDYPELHHDDARILLVEGMPRLLDAFPDSLGRYAERQLRRRGIEVVTGTLVQSATGEAVSLSTGEEISTRTIVWSAGVRPTEPVRDAGVAIDRSRSGRIEVDEHLRVRGTPGLFAIGDVASVDAGGEELPMLSPPAMQEGRYVARLIARGAVDGAGVEAAPPFRYVDKGTMATIGRNAAVARIGPFRLTGFLGWATWLFIHLYYLIGFRNRLVVLAEWTWEYLRRDRPIRLIARVDPDPLARFGEELVLGADAGDVDAAREPADECRGARSGVAERPSEGWRDG